MTTTYSSPATAPDALAPVRARLLFPLAPSARETVQFYDQAGGDHGYIFLPHDQAYDLISRLQDIPVAIHKVDRSVAGHVRHMLDDDYRNPDDEPDNWTVDLIGLIADASEQERSRLARIYGAYVVAWEIGTGPGGVTALAKWHEALTDQSPAETPAASSDGTDYTPGPATPDTSPGTSLAG
ncbi:hypothetical protein HD597_010054 [Nonomuraea thailandensis]|uniref:Uncharacterized protein n=1 Tax=Nonomuraea thailandensis TaxID=1188745 RepID=A0A9X2GT08_9ACTN|nr:hypothetical protein [Nonomuraea thailandensis]MCP2363034.1 hypothetical protein [Nonomuraea thailandensis]